MKQKILVGILAFQGDVAEHKQVLDALKVQSMEVTTSDDLKDVTHLIIPGGESTVMARFLESSGLDAEIQARAANATLPVLGTCAGAILLARKAMGKNAPKTLNLINMIIDRNAYGTQLDSFEKNIKVKGTMEPVAVSFIRAPIIMETGDDAEILATDGGHPILVRQGRNLAATFHPEMRGETAIHKMFLGL
jgi:5'-phosphate synthase pdxT subunit